MTITIEQTVNGLSVTDSNSHNLILNKDIHSMLASIIDKLGYKAQIIIKSLQSPTNSTYGRR